MQKSWTILALLTVLLVAACAPQGTVAPTAAATDTAAPKATATEATATAEVAPSPAATSDGATCTVSGFFPASGPEEGQVIIPAVSDQDWSQGPEDARMTIVEYSDFQCPYCGLFDPVLEQFQQDHADNVRVVFRHLPLPMHTNANLAAQAAEAAGNQGAFFEMKHALFSQQSEWSTLDEEQFTDWLVKQATTLGLDEDQFSKDMTSDAVVEKVNAAYNEAVTIGIPGTPFLFINGIPYQGARDADSLAGLLVTMQKEFDQCPSQVIDPDKSYTATITTDKGDIVVELYAKEAPITVNSFVFLARNGWYDGVPFHRVMEGFVAQSGDPSGTGYGGPGYSYVDEIDPDLKYDREGLLGMANAGADTNGSQFFITLDALPDLDGKYTIFGEVTEGMDVVKALTQRDPSSSEALPTPSKIISVTIEEK